MIVPDGLLDFVIPLVVAGVAMGVWLVGRSLVNVARKSDRFDIW